MKKVLYSLMSLSIVLLFACGESPNATEDSSAEKENMEMEESHEGHDHAAMEEKAKDQTMQAIPEGSRIFFKNLIEGQLVKSPLHIQFGIEGMTVHPAGELLEGTGHHHLIIEELPVPAGEVVPADENHIHFGGGQLETEIELMPGPHVLTLQFADGLHRSYGPEMSATIMVEVEPEE